MRPRAELELIAAELTLVRSRAGGVAEKHEGDSETSYVKKSDRLESEEQVPILPQPADFPIFQLYLQVSGGELGIGPAICPLEVGCPAQSANKLLTSSLGALEKQFPSYACIIA